MNEETLLCAYYCEPIKPPLAKLQYSVNSFVSLSLSSSIAARISGHSFHQHLSTNRELRRRVSTQPTAPSPARNTTNSISTMNRTQLLLHILWYTTTILLTALTAGWCTRQAALAQSQEGLLTHHILQLTAIRTMEQGEWQAVKAQQAAAANAVDTARGKSAVYNAAVAVDVQQEQHWTQQSDQLQQLALQEHDHATAMWNKVHDVDAVRLELLHQLEAECSHE